jgi:hypothetical protein
MRSFTDASLLLGAAILGVAALWHFYWAIGGRAGLRLALPEKEGRPLFLPSRAMTAFVAALIAAVAGVYAVVALDPFINPDYAEWAQAIAAICGFVFVMRAIGDFGYVGFFKHHTGTAFAMADSRFYSPLCLYLGVAGLLAGVPAVFQLIG